MRVFFFAIDVFFVCFFVPFFAHLLRPVLVGGSSPFRSDSFRGPTSAKEDVLRRRRRRRRRSPSLNWVLLGFYWVLLGFTGFY